MYSSDVILLWTQNSFRLFDAACSMKMKNVMQLDTVVVNENWRVSTKKKRTTGDVGLTTAVAKTKNTKIVKVVFRIRCGCQVIPFYTVTRNTSVVADVKLLKFSFKLNFSLTIVVIVLVTCPTCQPTEEQSERTK